MNDELKILLIEDSMDDAELVKHYFSASKLNQYDITHVKSLQEAFFTLNKKSFAVTIADLNLPDSDKNQTFTSLAELDPNMPVVFLTAENNLQQAVLFVREGADDYIIKGEVNRNYLERAIHYAIDRRKKLNQLNQENKQLKRIIQLDALTGVYSRRYGEELIREEINRNERFQIPFSIILVDVDNFKKINDEYGHCAGDKSLIQVALHLQVQLRDMDKAIRYGGDEFVLLLPHSDRMAAKVVAERILQKRFKIGRKKEQDHLFPITFSLGIAFWEPGLTLRQLISRADEAMYYSKREGKNRYTIYRPGKM